MRTPALPSAVQDGLTPSSTTRAPSVDSVVAALAAKAALTVFTSVAAGLVPASGGGTTNFLRADGTWAEPPGGGGGGGGDVASVFGRTGVVTAQSGDYSFAQIGSTPTTLAGYGINDAAPLVHVGAGGGAHANVVASGASGFMTGADKAKLDGVAANATANSSDATLLARANHTGQQAASTIQDFNSSVDVRIGTHTLVSGANVTLNYNAGTGQTTVNATGTLGATIADGNYGDVTVSSTGTVIAINAAAVTLAKMANLPTDTIIGRDTAGTGVPEQLTVTGGLEFTGSGGIQTSALTGDVTKSAGGTSLSIAAAAVTFAKFQNIGTDTLIGRDTAGSGAPEAIALNATLQMDGAGNLQRSALTGDVTAAAGSNATTIANSSVSLAKMANLAQDQVIGRVTASTGVPETFTVTASARSVLDDVSVSAMVNTLGGGTATGTGVLVRENTPTLVTPVLGAATATSIAIGGGTALTTTNRTGTGNLVLATSPTLTTASLSGIYTTDGADVMTPNAMGALVIDVTKALNTKSISADQTFTFSGTPATANTWFRLLLTNTDSNAHLATIPSSFDTGLQQTVTVTPIPAAGKLLLSWFYDGSVYNLFGAGPYLNKYDATVNPGVNDDVSLGYGPGSLWLNATSNVAYICESNADGAAVWNAMGGGVSDADYGGITVAAGVWSVDPGHITLARLADIATDKLIGRDTAGTGVPEAIGVTGGIAFDGSGNIQTTAFTGDVTKSAGGTALTIANSAVSLAKMADLLQSRFIGRVTASTGAPESMTGTQATTLLDVFTSTLKGLVPGGSGGGTANFLRADGAWASPGGAGTVTNTGGNLTSNSIVLGAGTTDTKVVAGIISDGTSKITLGVAGASVGGLLLANATSGTIEIRPTTGALGTTVLTAPAGTDTLVTLGASQVLTGKTISAASNTLTVTQGKHLVPVMAGGMTPSATGGCAALAVVASAANQPDIVTLDFDATTQEYAQFSIPMPESWNEGTVTFQAIWSHPSTTTNFGVAWDLQAVAVSDDDAIAVAYGTAQVVTDTGGTTNDVYVTAESSAITIAGTPANKDTLFFRLSRVTGNGSDTMAVDARLHGVRLYFTTNAETDA
jgi:hypothetical protein